MPSHSRKQNKNPLAFLNGGGEMGQYIREYDWSKTELGSPENWPPNLQTAVSICLNSRYPVVIWWGNSSFIQFYNDAYVPMLGITKHPGWLGRSGQECWKEIWPVMGPMWEKVFATGEATWCDDFMWIFDRNLPQEETYVTFAYSPILEKSGTVEGIFCVCRETTERVIGERRLQILRELTSPTSNGAKSALEACQFVAKILEPNAKDIPFALQYLLDEEGKSAFLAATTGIEAGTMVSPSRVSLLPEQYDPWEFLTVMETQNHMVITDLKERFSPLPGGPWENPSTQALVLPITTPKQKLIVGFIVVGVSSRRPLDNHYRGFFDLLVARVTTLIINAKAYEEECRRVEALAELDRAKTAFFSNVSHEFRTPLTLMLGPIKEMMDEADEKIAPILEVVHRNGLRLQRLVNTLLDFSRIEAGHDQACFEPIDIAALTKDLASNFRSACDKAGLKFTVNCPPIKQIVFLDRYKWEKIVFNLLSNAFKFTFEGQISISIQQLSHTIELKVTDTGIGISPEEMPKIFDRFHRIKNDQGRTYEGSGIGLALTHELIKLHGGTIKAESKVGTGTVFVVSIPLGYLHLPQEQVQFKNNSVETEIKPFLEETLHWFAEPQAMEFATIQENNTPQTATPKNSVRILVADDNADMRHYLLRLLSPLYRIEAVSDGKMALAAIRACAPDLIITDVMMPHVDGFALLKEIRANPQTASIPVIMLSARAGEESRVDGVEAGADDYLVKPFSARMLLATVSSQLKMAAIRREANEAIQENEKRFSAWFSATTDVVYRMSPDWDEMQYLRGKNFVVDTLKPSRAWDDKYLHTEDQHYVRQAIQKAIESKDIFELEHRVIRADGTPGWTHSRAIPIFNNNNEIVEWFGAASDVTRRKEAEHALREASRHKDEFLAILAHELRNPLAPLCNGLQIMRYAKDNPDSFANIWEVMDRQLAQMVRLVDDLLDLSRISSGKIVLQKETVELTSILQQAIETNRSIIEAAEQEVDFAVLCSPVYVDADVIRLAQIFSNLLINASKYTEKCGKIRLSMQQKGDKVIISIRDNGIGIPEHMVPQIFNMFTQIDRNMDHHQGGLGIGLSVVKKLVELHRGTVEVNSEGDNLGSEFIVQLPIVSSLDKAKDINSETLHSPAKRRILIVDDNEDVAASLEMLLKLMGNTTQTAGDGQEAIAIAGSFRPDVIFMDIGMPRLNGYETAKEMRKLPWGEKVVLIALTGWGQDEARRNSQEAGFDFHITKPAPIAVLEQLLANIGKK